MCVKEGEEGGSVCLCVLCVYMEGGGGVVHNCSILSAAAAESPTYRPHTPHPCQPCKVYAVVIGGMCASQHGAAKNTDAENLGLLAGMGAGFAGTGFSLFCIFLCFTCVDRVKPGKLNDSVEKGFGEAAAGYGEYYY